MADFEDLLREVKYANEERRRELRDALNKGNTDNTDTLISMGVGALIFAGGILIGIGIARNKKEKVLYEMNYKEFNRFDEPKKE